MTPEELEAWVRKSCEEQGVPVKVTDPATISKVATLLGGSTWQKKTRRSRRARTAGANS